MAFSELLEAAATHLLRRQDLERSGVRDRRITALERSGELIRLRAGSYVVRDFWETALPEARHAAAMLAARDAARVPPVFSHRSAALLHGFPAWSGWLSPSRLNPLRVHTTVARGTDTTSTRVVRRHIAKLSRDDVTTVAGFACTATELTLVDLARSDAFEVALASADSHLRASTRSNRDVSEKEWSAWRDRLERRAAAMPGYSGVRAVRALADLADPRAESPLESVSRLRLLQLGLVPDLQVMVPGRTGGRHYLDFVLPELGFWGECDGKTKYTSSEFLGGSSAEEVVYQEKRRQDWIAGTTGLRCIRWGVSEVSTLERFAEHLRAHGVSFPGVPSVVHSPATARFLAALP